MLRKGELSNSFTRPQNAAVAQFEASTPLFEGDELEDLRSDTARLKPGDLVELSSQGSRRPVLAICLGRFNGYEHYYTSGGKWFYGLGVRTLFVVHGFASVAELEPIIAELPSTEAPLEKLNALQDLGHSPTRSSGASLLVRMLEFVQSSEAIYQANAGTLDASSAFIGDPEKHRYLTLHEIADLLLPDHLKEDGKFNPSALYAVHRALLQDEVFFRPLKETGHRRSYLFEVSPLSEVRIVQRVENIVRQYLELQDKARHHGPKIPSPMSSFVKTARKVIDQSRKHRVWTESGIIGPSTAEEPQLPEWSAADIEILQFIELWAGYQKFPNYSRFQCIGSAILRAVDRYQDAETLTPSMGWTFLQEVRWIPPWEIPARYRTRFPGVEIKRGGGYTRPLHGMLDRHIKKDIFADGRKDWDGVTAYCIDAVTTMDIDDAVSLERTSVPGQYWIHVHVADPASSIAAETPVAKYAELMPETIYLPGHFERMLPSNLSQEMFSLAPNRPCLTFSALVNDDGMTIEHRVTPGRLTDIVYMTPEDVASAIGEKRADPLVVGDALAIGHVPENKAPPRKVTRPEDLSQQQRADLSKLSELGKAIQAERLNRGATPFYHPRPEPQAYFDRVSQEDKDGFILTLGDPSIRIAYPQRSGTELVEHAMRLAGEIAARWCHERGIPIPFRTQPNAIQNADLIQQYTRDVFYPLLAAGIRPEDNQWRHLQALLGGDEISATAGPHFTLGADMYTKATSPLRRFSDLIVHWQIEAAILHERRHGKSLIGNKDDSFLPFSRERLDRMLPMLRVRERQVRALTRGDGADQWILQALVRAWRFNEAEIPETFRFSVVHLVGRRSIMGRLDWFDRPALLRPETLNDVAKMADVRIGDVFRVKLKDVNVHAKQIVVEALELLERAGDDAAAAMTAQVKETPAAQQLEAP
ncbi:hypothetical protein DL768_004550 [Monosporascus sp. mg162]|nr:hypothetical protein DL768_004550 [Monosporascus sp. mg162]